MVFSRNAAIIWESDKLKLLDQRLLPHKEEYLEYENGESVANAIKDMVVRGAPAIGVSAAYAVVLAARQLEKQNIPINRNNMQSDFDLLAKSRPTAVNLFFALNCMSLALELAESNSNPLEILELEALKIHREDAEFCEKMGKLGAEQIEANSNVYTHCNAGALATGGMGTAVGVISTAHKLEKIKHVFVDETRPWMQGSRLTSWELKQEGIPHQLCIEGAAAFNMSRNNIHWVIVGADRIAANGDAANKIGTYNLAVVARHHNVKFMVVAPSSTIDWTLSQGKDIPIEFRKDSEITGYKNIQISPPETIAPNPVFDVTPAELIDCIVCEKGVIHQPNAQKMAAWR